MGGSSDARHECLAEVRCIETSQPFSRGSSGHLHEQDDTCRLEAFRSTSLSGLPRLQEALAMRRGASATGLSLLTQRNRKVTNGGVHALETGTTVPSGISKSKEKSKQALGLREDLRS